MHHFFLPESCFGGEQVEFPAVTSRQIASVLRLAPGSRVVALDNQGKACLVELVEVSSKRAAGRVLDAGYVLPPEPRVKLTVYAALTQREKFELILQKGTELGACAFVPVICSRSLAQSAADVEGKRERWEGILREAAEQCGRLRIPALSPALRWSQAVKSAQKQHELNLVLWENEKETDLDAAFSANPYAEDISIFIGPEGGIAEEEIKLIEGDTFVTVSLGARILRMETAAIAVTAILLHRYGCMRVG